MDFISSTSRCIVAVDDNEDDRFIFARLVKTSRLSYPLEVIGDGEEAVQRLSAMLMAGERPLICFIDIKMPGLNGFDLLKWIRTQDALDSVPIVMLSSSEEKSDVAKAAEMGAQGYLKKHPSSEELRAIIAQTLELGANRKPTELFVSEANLLRSLDRD